MNTSGFQRHSSLYIADGNICLSAASSRFIAPVDGAAEATQPAGLLFRVHRSVLALHSPVFRDMLGIPDMSGASETYDGVSLVQMPDSAEDLEGLLKAFYHGYKLPYPRLDPRTPDGVRSILVMANKHQVDSIRQQIVERLESDWPQSFVEWQRQEAELEAQLEYNKRTGGRQWSGERPSRIDNAFPEPASAIRLARDCNIPSILPAAFYHLSRLTIEDDWDLIRTPHHQPSLWGFRCPSRTARWSLLNGDDLRFMLAGKLAFRKNIHADLCISFCPSDFATESDEDLDDVDEDEQCDFSDKCPDRWTTVLRERIRRGLDADPLKCVTDMEKTLTFRTICGSCERRLKAGLNGDTIWRKLPAWFGLV